MTSYVKLYPAQITDGRWAGANKGAFSVHMAAISYCDEHNADQKSDGCISRHDALRLKAPCVSPEEMPLAIKSLLQRGFWRQDGRGHYQIVQYLAHARSAEQILTDRAHNTADKARRSQHAAGDHSLCVDPRHCPAMAKAHAARDHSLCKDLRFCKYLPRAPKAKATPRRTDEFDWTIDPQEWPDAQSKAYSVESQRAFDYENNVWKPTTKWANVVIEGPEDPAKDADKDTLAHYEEARDVFWELAAEYERAWLTDVTGYPAFMADQRQRGVDELMIKGWEAEAVSNYQDTCSNVRDWD